MNTGRVPFMGPSDILGMLPVVHSEKLQLMTEETVDWWPEKKKRCIHGKCVQLRDFSIEEAG